MTTTRYLELNSTYRDRNLYPNPFSFEVNIAPSPRDRNQALDPISNAYPTYIFRPGDFDLANTGAYFCDFQYDIANAPAIPATSSNLNFVVHSSATCLGNTGSNYYVGAVLQNIGSMGGATSTEWHEPRRIISWQYLNYATGATGSTGTNFLVGVEKEFYTFDDYALYRVYNPTDFGDITSPYIFIPQSLPIPNYYDKYLLYNEDEMNSVKILGFDKITHLAKLAPVPNTWTKADTFILRKEDPVVKDNTNAIVASIALPDGITYNTTSNVIYFTDSNSVTSKFVSFTNAFIRFKSKTVTAALQNQIRKIRVEYNIQQTQTTPVPVFKNIGYHFFLDTPLPATPTNADDYEILQYTRDSYSPFFYSGSMSSQNQQVGYEVELVSLIIPNSLLQSGGRAAYYTYVYVELQNVTSPNGGLSNIIYSNNPNSRSAIFLAPITDINDPVNSPFVKIDAKGTSQTISFKPNDNLRLTIRLPSGEIPQTIKTETPQGEEPDPLLQISALFAIKRV